ncbi:MAG TPA: SCO family protein [Methylomirabilota bacterium]|jgi:cytochrome oxidase Cu insertion factor (SCO1/SenC/PrrC family)
MILRLLLVLVIVGATPARAHEIPRVDEEFIKGAFTPSFVPPAPGTYELPVVSRVGAFVLRDTAGRRVSTSAVMAGKVAVVSFIYTACAERLGCPLASAALRQLQSRLRDEGLAGEAVLLTISFDAERDTPAQLAKYAHAFGADPALWRFMAAPDARVLDGLLRSYGQDRAPVHDERGRFTGRYRHVLKVFLVDRDARVRNVYSTGFLVPQVVLNDIKTVLGP